MAKQVEYKSESTTKDIANFLEAGFVPVIETDSKGASLIIEHAKLNVGIELVRVSG